MVRLWVLAENISGNVTENIFIIVQLFKFTVNSLESKKLPAPTREERSIMARCRRNPSRNVFRMQSGYPVNQGGGNDGENDGENDNGGQMANYVLIHGG